MKFLMLISLLFSLSVGKVLDVYVSFYPLEYFTQKIAGSLANVTNPVEEGSDPAFWQPSREQMINMQKADLLILNGAEFEKWATVVNLPESKLLRSANGFKKNWIKYENAVTHSHGGGTEHSHEGVDGHTWLSPENAQAQSKAILNALTKLLPAEKATLEKNYSVLEAELKKLDKGWKELNLSEKLGHVLMSHPAYNYLGKSYGWKFSNLDLDPESMPGPKSLDKIKRLVDTTKAKYLIWEAAPKKEISEKLKKDFGLTSLVISPGESLSEEDKKKGLDYISIMENNIKGISSLK